VIVNMKIDLKNINVYILTIPQNVERLTQLTSQLENKLSFEIFYGICLTHPIGCDISLIKLWNKIKLPALVLEDDCFITEDFKLNIDVPDDSDAIYLGTSLWGVKNGESKLYNFELEKYNDSYFKLNCMTSFHAVLFLTDKYLNSLKEIGKMYPVICQPNGMGIDYYTSQEQYKYNIYGLSRPFFYQTGIFTETVTKPSLENYDLFIKNNHSIDEFKST
jgi:GR25 family glycosyltransferase involved in LPS biosynthesis